MAVSFAVRIGAGEPLLGLPMLLPLPVDAAGADAPVKTIAMLAGLVTMWVVSRATQSACPAIPLELEAEVMDSESGPCGRCGTDITEELAKDCVDPHHHAVGKVITI